ncbi:hypothetical protein DYB25_010856 [Aphanomyces astaci]|uniref:EamA domain-containing protein n=3 Tax=Aphanomyces astaci TaxID=112090 RepID=A0A397AVC2_APHAT|nr:hypothetical protein DYB25_010856 [Aphanomyces astaci]RHY44564.1 hypothetical protein DYB38_011849 [Aphanomyces astaci]RHY91751.1 hypothetical protein DYB35_004318 [Aphanomyces astaci]
MTHASEACGSHFIALFTLLTGSMNTIIMKMQFDMVAQGTEQCDVGDGITSLRCAFHKPWFGVLQVKLGMTLCLVYLVIRKKLLHRPYLETPLPLHDPTHTHKLFIAVQEWPSTRTLVATVVPAALDLVQSIFSFVGLLWIPASVYQMSGGSMLIFSAFISVKFMHVHLFLYNYISLALVAFALVLVSIAGSSHESESAPSDAWNTFVGMVFILLSRLGYSVNIAIEEYFMTTLHVSPILQAGMEGVWGLVLFVPLVPLLTWTEPGSSAVAKIWHEDFVDTWAKLQQSPALVGLVVVYVLSIAAYNVRSTVVYAMVVFTVSRWGNR